MMIDEGMIEANIYKHENCKMLKIFKECFFFVLIWEDVEESKAEKVWCDP